MIKTLGLAVSILVCSYPTYSQYLNHDTDILIVNVGDADRYKIAEAIEFVNKHNPKVIGINLVFTDKRERDSVFLRQFSKSVPIILPVNWNNDSSYFSLSNCKNGRMSFDGNEKNRAKFAYPMNRVSGKLRDSFEFLILKYFDPSRYQTFSAYFKKRFQEVKRPNKYLLKGEIDFNCDNAVCFNDIKIEDIETTRPDLIENSIILFGYLGDKPNVPADEDKDINAHLFYSTKKKGQLIYMYDTLIIANVISDLVNMDIRPEELKKYNIEEK